MATTLKNVVQIKNHITGYYLRINTERERITGRKKTPGPYKGIPVVRSVTRDTRESAAA